METSYATWQLLGVAFVICWQALAMGDLVQVLPYEPLPQSAVYAVYPQTRFLSCRARAFIDFISQRYGDNPYWDQSSLTDFRIR